MAFEVGRKLSEEAAFRLAMRKARNALGHCSPNPPVGCVILDKNFGFLCSGFTQPPGKNHAEVDALEKLPEGASLEGAHVFVTLEPCSHQGRTPPCSTVLAKLPITSVTYGIQDPNPLVDGKGLDELRSAGIEVKKADEDFDQELRKLNEVFLYNVQENRPFVSVKVATSLDGQIGLKTGESKWITSCRAREHSHYIRSQHDAILVGVNTFLFDNPSLDVRHGPFEGKELKVILIDPSGRSFSKLKDSNLMKVHKPENIWVISTEETDVGVQCFKTHREGPRKLFDFAEVLDQLYDNGVSSVMVEGGAWTASQFLNQKLAQRMYQYIAPSYIGGRSGSLFTEDLRVPSLAEKIVLCDTQIKKLSPDFLVTGRLD